MGGGRLKKEPRVVFQNVCTKHRHCDDGGLAAASVDTEQWDGTRASSPGVLRVTVRRWLQDIRLLGALAPRGARPLRRRLGSRIRSNALTARTGCVLPMAKNVRHLCPNSIETRAHALLLGPGKRFCLPQPLLAQAGGHVEPFAYHIINRWFDEYFLRAVARTRQLRAPRCLSPAGGRIRRLPTASNAATCAHAALLSTPVRAHPTPGAGARARGVDMPSRSAHSRLPTKRHRQLQQT